MKLGHKRDCARWAMVGALVAACAGFALLPACLSPDKPLSDDQLASAVEPDCAELTYENFGRPFFQAYCVRCHSDTNESDLARTDAPQGIDFDTLEMARPFINRIRLRAGVQGDMPPQLMIVPHPSDEQRIQLLQWLDCGMPTEADRNGG